MSDTVVDDSLTDYLIQARAWLAARRPRRSDEASDAAQSDDRVALFRSYEGDDEARFVQLGCDWQREKFDAGYACITWPAAVGGRGLPAAFERGFARVESEFEVPGKHEILDISVSVIARTLQEWGSDIQKTRHVGRIGRADELWCQLFSEPSAGSDLRSVATRAERDGRGWRLSGEKVWTSGARHADYGLALCRTSEGVSANPGLSVFRVAMADAGVEVRPLRQMTGGSSFTQVFFDGVSVHEDDLIGPLDRGWDVLRSTLRYERSAFGSATGGPVPGLYSRIVDLARRTGRTSDLIVRQHLARIYSARRIQGFTTRRAIEQARRGDGGSVGSIAKLQWTEGLRQTSELAAQLLGPLLAADSGEWGTFAWAEFVNGVPGYRIAGGTDEIQRNAIAERILGLPREARQHIQIAR